MGKALRLLGLAARGRAEFLDRIRAIFEVKLEACWVRKPVYQPLELPVLLSRLSEASGTDLASFVKEPAIDEVKRQVTERKAELASSGPFVAIHSADFDLASACYALCRAFNPGVVLETGVAYGVTSSFILKAMELNGKGSLHSVDLPPLGRDADSFVGSFIPPALRHRWTLHRGASRRILPRLLPSLGTVDVFIHDSLHTYGNMKFEFHAVTPYLTKRAVVVADDIADNDSFGEWCRERSVRFEGVASEPQKKGNAFGIALTT
jgi:hypothetical protein